MQESADRGFATSLTSADAQRLDFVVQACGIGLWLNPMPLGELVWNANTKAHFHLPPEARVDMALFWERVHADDRRRVDEALATAIASRSNFDVVYRTVGPEGAVKWIRAIGRPRFDADGTPVQFDGITLDVSQLKAGEAQVQQSTERLRSFADSAPAMLWVTELDGSCSFLSHSWYAFTGQAEGQGLGFGWLSAVHPDEREATRDALMAASAQGSRFEVEHRLQRADGSWNWVINAGQPRFSPDGGFLGCVGSVTDIDGRRQAEDALRTSEKRYRKLLASIDQGFCVIEILLDAQGRPYDYRFLEANGVFERQTGLENVIGRTAREVVPGLEAHWYERYGEVALTGRALRFTEHSPAMRRWFDVYATPTGDAAARQVALLFNDITDRKRTEYRLRRNEERYRAFVANSTEGIWRMEFDPPVDTRLPAAEQARQLLRNGRFAECNDAFARMYGYDSASELLGQGLGLMLAEGDPGTTAYLEALAAQGYRASEIESAERDRNGHLLYFANSLSGTVENGLLVRAWGTQRDVTDRKKAELALVEADRRKDEFLATLAHELRNPLAPIRSAVELLRIKAPPVPELVRSREIIDKQVTHLTRLIDDLLDISRITRDKLELRMERVPVSDIVNGALESTRTEMENGRHPLHLDLPSEALYLQGDPVRLVQVLMNLLTNAARYSAPGAPIWLTVGSEGDDVVVSVRDVGHGIAAHQLPRVFDMFFQGGERLDRSHGGLGIGLSLVQRLTQLHGGRVEARSEGVNEGSEFTVRLPLAQPPVPVQAAEQAASAPDDRNVRQVLVVDDNQDSADTLAEVLRLMGCEANTAYDGVEGVEKAQQLRPDALVLDLGMPRMNGFEACRRIREQPWGQSMKIVAVSGWGQQEDRRRSAEAGFDAHLVKPVVPDVLLEVIESLPQQRAAKPQSVQVR